MNASDLHQFEFLWTNPKGDWTLLKSRDLQGGYCVFNKLGSVLLIEDAEIKEAVCKKMIDAGCEVLEGIPNGQAAVSVTMARREKR